MAFGDFLDFLFVQPFRDQADVFRGDLLAPQRNQLEQFQDAQEAEARSIRQEATAEEIRQQEVEERERNLLNRRRARREAGFAGRGVLLQGSPSRFLTDFAREAEVDIQRGARRSLFRRDNLLTAARNREIAGDNAEISLKNQARGRQRAAVTGVLLGGLAASQQGGSGPGGAGGPLFTRTGTRATAAPSPEVRDNVADVAGAVAELQKRIGLERIALQRGDITQADAQKKFKALESDFRKNFLRGETDGVANVRGGEDVVRQVEARIPGILARAEVDFAEAGARREIEITEARNDATRDRLVSEGDVEGLREFARFEKASGVPSDIVDANLDASLRATERQSFTNRINSVLVQGGATGFDLQAIDAIKAEVDQAEFLTKEDKNALKAQAIQARRALDIRKDRVELENTQRVESVSTDFFGRMKAGTLTETEVLRESLTPEQNDEWLRRLRASTKAKLAEAGGKTAGETEQMNAIIEAERRLRELTPSGRDGFFKWLDDNFAELGEQNYQQYAGLARGDQTRNESDVYNAFIEELATIRDSGKIQFSKKAGKGASAAIGQDPGFGRDPTLSDVQFLRLVEQLRQFAANNPDATRDDLETYTRSLLFPAKQSIAILEFSDRAGALSGETAEQSFRRRSGQ